MNRFLQPAFYLGGREEVGVQVAGAAGEGGRVDAGDLLAGLDRFLGLQARALAGPAEHGVGGRLGGIGGEGDRTARLGGGGAQRDVRERRPDCLPGRDLEVPADQDRDEQATQYRRLVVELGGDEVDEDRRALGVPDQDDRLAAGVAQEPLPGGEHAVVGDGERRAHEGLVAREPLEYRREGL
jgi:hypothetical protein